MLTYARGVIVGVVLVVWGLAVATNFQGITDWYVRRRWRRGYLLHLESPKQAPSRRGFTWWRVGALVAVIYGCALILGRLGVWSW